jgi:hypothetical protein
MRFTLRMGPILGMAVIFSGLASMPLSDTMYPSSFPFGTLKVQFLGLNLMLNLWRLANVASSVVIRSPARGAFTTMLSS